MTIEIIIGIDPGRGGGIAVWRPNRKMQTYAMPSDFDRLADLFRSIKELSPYVLCVIEKVNFRPGDNINGKMYKIEKMKQNYDELKTILRMIKMPFILVHPMKWQNYLNIRMKGECYDDKKKRFKLVAKTYYPETNITLKTCDAVLLVEFMRRMLRNDEIWVNQQLPTEALKTLL